MNGFRLFAVAAAVVAMGNPFAAQAGTIISGAAQPATATLTTASPQALVKYTFQIKYFNQEKPACGARLDYGDGRPAEMMPIQNPTASVTRDVAYAAPGAYKMTLSGSAFNGMVACLGSTTVSATVIKSVPIGAIAGSLGAGTLQPVPGQNPGAPATGKSIADLNLGGAGTLQPVGGQPPGGAAPGAGTGISNLNLGATTLQPVGGPPQPHDGVALPFSMDTPIFTYGVRQGFKLKEDSSGGICHFSMRVMSDHVISNTDYAVTLPWTSPDLKLPALPDGKSYTVRLTALSNSLGHYTGNNGCWGEYTGAPFQVVQMGKLSTITTSALMVATGQVVDFNVQGENFGACQYSFVVGPRYRPRPPAQTVSYLPYKHSTSFPAAGDFFASADEIDVNGVALGCTGQIASNTVKVIDRPACPSPQYAYKNDGDSEYGCKFPSSVQSTITENYSCPTGYVVFKTPGAQMQYGCRRGPALGETTAQASAPQNDTPDKPTLKKIQLVAVSGGSIPRPNSNIVYAGDALRLDISGNLPNNAGFGNQCGYTVALENVATHVSKEFNFDTFDIHAFGAAPIAGEYSVKATPHPHGNVPGCLGEAAATITLHPAAAWLTGLKLTGFGYHFKMADEGLYPQFCNACMGSVFSPAHDSAFLRTVPLMASGPNCGYIITQNGHDTIEAYIGGNVIPAGKTDFEPFMSKWGNGKNTVTVTVKGFAGLPPLPACNGSFTKTVTWSDDPSLPPVVVQ